MHTSKDHYCDYCTERTDHSTEAHDFEKMPLAIHTKENHFLDVGCPSCGHIPQSDRHLCETKEEWEKEFDSTFYGRYHMNEQGPLTVGIKDFIRNLLSHERTESYAQGYNDGARETREKVRDAIKQGEKTAIGRAIKRIEEEMHKLLTFPKHERPDAHTVLILVKQTLQDDKAK